MSNHGHASSDLVVIRLDGNDEQHGESHEFDELDEHGFDGKSEHIIDGFDGDAEYVDEHGFDGLIGIDEHHRSRRRATVRRRVHALCAVVRHQRRWRHLQGELLADVHRAVGRCVERWRASASDRASGTQRR